MKQFLAALLVLLLLIGCAPSEEPAETPTVSAPPQNLEPTVEEPEPVDTSQFVGTWSGKYESTSVDSTVSSKEATQMRGMLQEYRATLELREDGTYRLIAMVGVKPIEDTWETDGDTIVLASSGPDGSTTGITEMGSPNGEEYVLTVAEDGSLIGHDPIQQGRGAMVFRRQ